MKPGFKIFFLGRRYFDRPRLCLHSFLDFIVHFVFCLLFKHYIRIFFKNVLLFFRCCERDDRPNGVFNPPKNSVRSSSWYVFFTDKPICVSAPPFKFVLLNPHHILRNVIIFIYSARIPYTEIGALTYYPSHIKHQFGFALRSRWLVYYTVGPTAA